MVYIPIVDRELNVIGYGEKLYVHQNPVLHLAFSLVLYKYENDTLEILLQRRSPLKYHCPLKWANSCCSHPKSIVSMINDVHRRTQEELGLTLDKSDIKLIDKFIYRECLDKNLTEYEFDHIFVTPYKLEYELCLNPDEVCEVQWCSLDAVNDLIKTSSAAPWLKYVLKSIERHQRQLIH